MKMIQLTKWGLKDEELDSQYGKIKYLDWCEKERERIMQDKKRIAEVKERNDYCMLMVNEVTWDTMSIP